MAVPKPMPALARALSPKSELSAFSLECGATDDDDDVNVTEVNLVRADGAAVSFVTAIVAVDVKEESDDVLSAITVAGSALMPMANLSSNVAA